MSLFFTYDSGLPYGLHLKGLYELPYWTQEHQKTKGQENLVPSWL